MKNKIIFILILILSFISIPVYASEITIEEFTTAYEEYVINSWGKYGRTATVEINNTSNFEEALQEYDNFSIFYRVGSTNNGTTLYFDTYFYNDDVKLYFSTSSNALRYESDNNNTEKYYYNERGSTFIGDTKVSVSIQGSISDRSLTWTSESGKYYANPTINGTSTVVGNIEDYEVVTTADIYSGYQSEDIKYSANVGNVEAPYDGMYFGYLKEFYEYGDPIEVTLYAGDYSGDYIGDVSNIYINFNIYKDGQKIFGYLNQSTDIKPMLTTESFDKDTNSWTFNLLDYYPVFIGDDYTYELYAQTYNAETDKQKAYSTEFYIKFPDVFVVNEGTSYDITPTITAYPLSASVQKTVTITSPVDNTHIYYKLGENGVWRHYREPFVVTSNTTVYAMLLDSSNGQSAFSKYEIKNIMNMTEYNSRPAIGPEVEKLVKKHEGQWYVDLYVEYASNFGVEYSTDNMLWNDFDAIATHETNYINALPNCWHIEWKMQLPRVLYFRYVDSNGAYSPTTVVSIPAEETGIFPVKTPGGTLSPYDENGEYIASGEVIGSNKSPITLDSIYDSEGNIDTSNLVKSSFNNAWSFVSQYTVFFALVQSIFMFLPVEIMSIIISFLLIKFFIALIGFLRG